MQSYSKKQNKTNKNDINKIIKTLTKMNMKIENCKLIKI